MRKDMNDRKVYDLLYDHNIYEGLPRKKIDIRGWGGHREYFKKKIMDANEQKNRFEHTKDDKLLIIEVGTWKGKSAHAMASICKWENIPAEIVCVDTWLGATEFWENKEDEKRYKSLGLKNGYPSVYYQFLSNMVEKNVFDVVTPFPQTSSNAARFLRKHNVKADLIYIDGSHEYEDVLQDISAWWPILKDDHCMIGDDYCDYWAGVKKAVDQNFNKSSIQIERWENPDGAPSDYWCVRNDDYIPFCR